MHVVCLNYHYRPSLTDPQKLLERYETLVNWADALTAAGARVSVVQHFGTDAEVLRNEVTYRFVANQRHMNSLVVELRPDVVHVNGLQFARQASQLKRVLRVPILIQDHANPVPRYWPRRWMLRSALQQLDAVSFVSREQAKPWLDHGLLYRNQNIVEIMEGSSNFRLESRSDARARSGLAGDPVCLWVGRLNPNKDPLTVLSGFAKVLPKYPAAMLAMVYSDEELLRAVQHWLADRPAVSARVMLLGAQPHAALETLYNSADFFLLGSHHEGSGYAVLEALSCGVVPVVTDIPSFRVLTGDGKVGGLWTVGDSDALARTLIECRSRLGTDTPQQVRTFFEAHFQWSAIAQRTLDVYRQLVNRAGGA